MTVDLTENELNQILYALRMYEHDIYEHDSPDKQSFQSGFAKIFEAYDDIVTYERE